MNQIQTPETIPVPGKQLMQLDQWDRGVIIGLILGGSGQIIRYKTQQGTFLYSFYVTKTLNGFEPRKNYDHNEMLPKQGPACKFCLLNRARA